MSSPTILRIDASMRKTGSASRDLADALVSKLKETSPDADIIHRDLADGIALVDEAWIGANFTDPSERNESQKRALAQSDECVNELRQADVVVIGLPIYNFGVPAAFKAWIDLVCRARETFAYSSEGPKGLLENKKAYVVAVSGGTAIEGPGDYATAHVKHVLGFIGITDVTYVTADGLVSRRDEQMAAAKSAIAEL